MGARVTIDDSFDDGLWIELRQNGFAVPRVALVVLVMLAALYQLILGARAVPGLLLALVGVASGWLSVAVTAREVYAVSPAGGLITVLISSPTGRHRARIAACDVAGVELVIHDGRRFIDLIADDGRPCLRLPGRLTILVARDQVAIGRALARRLDVPLRVPRAQMARSSHPGRSPST